MTEATMSDVSDGLKKFISGYAAKSADKKFHIPYQRKDLALDLVKEFDLRWRLDRIRLGRNGIDRRD